MDDLISRQAAIDAVENAFDRETILNRFVRKIAISALRKMSSAQSERKRGNWINIRYSIYDNDSQAECDQCGATVHNNFSSVINYCPNCGAEMRGPENERPLGS